MQELVNQQALKDAISEELTEFARVSKTQVLTAVIEGSRAWGYATENSDYDIFFVFLAEEHLCTPLISPTANFVFAVKDRNYQGMELGHFMNKIALGSGGMLDILTLPQEHGKVLFTDHMKTLVEALNFDRVKYYLSALGQARTYLKNAMNNFPSTDITNDNVRTLVKSLVASLYRLGRGRYMLTEDNSKNVKLRDLYSFINVEIKHLYNCLGKKVPVEDLRAFLSDLCDSTVPKSYYTFPFEETKTASLDSFFQHYSNTEQLERIHRLMLVLEEMISVGLSTHDPESVFSATPSAREDIRSHMTKFPESKKDLVPYDFSIAEKFISKERKLCNFTYLAILNQIRGVRST